MDPFSATFSSKSEYTGMRTSPPGVSNPKC